MQHSVRAPIRPVLPAVRQRAELVQCQGLETRRGEATRDSVEPSRMQKTLMTSTSSRRHLSSEPRLNIRVTSTLKSGRRTRAKPGLQPWMLRLQYQKRTVKAQSQQPALQMRYAAPACVAPASSSR